MDGILCLDKPPEKTSFACCAMLRRFSGEKKVGHAGTLDPMATGVLPLLFGKATRVLPFLPSHDKGYRATLQFGKTSDTLDIWGTVTDTGKPYPTRAAVEEVLASFRGNIQQIPPMTSALKKDGVRLYELARQGIEIERQPRPVTVYRLEAENYDETSGQLTMACDCSAGTYIRTLCDDMGTMLGCGAVMTTLRRTMAAGFSLADCYTEQQCHDMAENGTLSEAMMPIDTVLSVYPALTVTAAQATRFANGGALLRNRLTAEITGITRVYHPDGTFLGLGQPQETDLRVLRLF